MIDDPSLAVEQSKRDPAHAAYLIIQEVMLIGSAKDGRDSSWREKSQDYHLDRAIRHIITYRLMRDGNQSPDGESHLKLAITRLSMALTEDK